MEKTMAKRINITPPQGVDPEQWSAKIRALARRHKIQGDISSETINALFRFYVDRDWDSAENQEWLTTPKGRGALEYWDIKPNSSR